MFGKLFILFVIVPLLELALFMSLGRIIGTGTTILIIILTAFLGAALAKSQGRAALANFQKALASGKMPHNEALDGIMILLAGAVLLTPGFLTDAIGFALLTPPVRAILRRLFAERIKDRIKVVTPGMPPQAQPEKRPSSLDDGNVIDI